MEFGETTRDCPPGHAVNDGPHLTITGASHGFFSSCGASVGFLTRYDGELREPLVRRQGSQVSMRVARGSASWLSSHGRGLGPRDAFKKDSRGLSRGAAGNPRFPRLLLGTLGNFQGASERRGILRNWRGLSGLHWVWRNGRGPHLEGRQAPQASSAFRTPTAGSLQRNIRSRTHAYVRSLRPCSDSSATPSFPSQPEGKIGLPRANPRGRLRSPS